VALVENQEEMTIFQLHTVPFLSTEQIIQRHQHSRDNQQLHRFHQEVELEKNSANHFIVQINRFKVKFLLPNLQYYTQKGVAMAATPLLV